MNEKMHERQISCIGWLCGVDFFLFGPTEKKKEIHTSTYIISDEVLTIYRKNKTFSGFTFVDVHFQDLFFVISLVKILNRIIDRNHLLFTAQTICFH